MKLQSAAAREPAYTMAPDSNEANGNKVPSKGAGGRGAPGGVAGKAADYRG